MTEDSNAQEIESLKADAEKAIAEAHDVISEAEEAMANLETLNQKLTASSGDLEELMPSNLYSEEERKEFVDALEQFVDDATNWLSEDVEASTDKEEAKKRKAPRGKRGFAV